MDDSIVSESLEFYGKVREEKGISITSLTREVVEGLIIYTAIGSMNGRQDSATGAVSIDGLIGLAKADAFKAAETQAKSRLTISLAGIRFKDASGCVKPEPEQTVVPTVNNAPADVVEDKRTPVVTETQLSNIHHEAQALSKQVNDPNAISDKPVAAALPEEQQGIFDEAPEPLLITQVPPVVVPSPTVDAVLAAVQPTTATGVTMPISIPKPVDQPTRLQYQAFSVRCAKLVHDKLPKAGKDIPNLLLPYLKRVFKVKDLTADSTSILLWEETLKKLEAASPAEAKEILNGK